MASHPTTLEKGRSITANGTEICVEPVGQGADVLLIGSLSDPSSRGSSSSTHARTKRSPAPVGGTEEGDRR